MSDSTHDPNRPPVHDGSPSRFTNQPTDHAAEGAVSHSVNGPASGARVIDFPQRSALEPDSPSHSPVDELGDSIPIDAPTPRRVRDPLVAPWSGHEVGRRPVIPPWLRNQTDLVAGARWLSGLLWHWTGFHTIRVPLYAIRLMCRCPLGVWVGLGRAHRWVYDAEGHALASTLARQSEAATYLKLAEARDARVRRRITLALATSGLLAVGLLVLWLCAPAWLCWVLGVAVVGMFGWVGSPADKPLTTRAVVVDRPTRLTSDVVVRALGSLGIAEINKAVSRGPGITFPAPITRDGPGWRAEVDLPYGVTAVDIIERRPALASGLRRPLGCVWPEPATDAHAGRLVLWVGDQDMASAKPPAWPLAKTGRANLFAPVPFGCDQRGRVVNVALVFANVLIGAMPRVGKTFALRVLLLAAALDPGVQLRIFELKGTGDLSMLEGCCHRYAAGADEDTLEAAMTSLRELYTELVRRSKVIAGLPRQVCPENKVTPELAVRRSLGLWLICVAIDECQELFSHPDYRDEAARLAEGIIKRGPAMGIILILATQRPDAKSLPTGVSANVGIRFCLRVMGQTENDMVLGTSSYKNGLRATVFGPRDKGIGYLVGASDDPQIVRTAYLDAAAAETIALRARGLREAAGALTGHATGQSATPKEGPARSILSDLAVVVTEDRLWSEEIVARLGQQWPSVYGQWTKSALAAALKPYGVAPRDIWGTTNTGASTTRRGYLRTDVLAALNHQHRNDNGNGG